MGAETPQRTDGADAAQRAADITTGRATLGVEFGSTRIKAVLVGPDLVPLASGGSEWDNEFVDGRWTYALDAVVAGLQAAYADLVADVHRRFGVETHVRDLAGLGVSAMMHGYLAFDADDALLVPFRTWRNTSTGPASAALGDALDFAVPLRWSIAHLYQAVLDDEPHVPAVARITTLAGHVHRALTGRDVLGVGDASGMFPIDPATRTWDATRLDRAQALFDERGAGLRLDALLPEVLVAGADAGTLTEQGAALIDPTGTLRAGVPLCPPEGDAGTGMVATNAVAPRTGNVSVGTSIFAMVVLERPLDAVHPELDIVTTPAGDAVAMVHCNNGASEFAEWARVFGRFATAAGTTLEPDAVYAVLLSEGLAADADAGGLLAYNYLAGEPVTGVDDGRPLLIRTPDSRFTLGNLVRAELFGAFATLSLGMEVLAAEHVAVERMLAHGGLFRTPGAAQQLLAAALGVPVAVGTTAGEGGAWGIAVLAAFRTAVAERAARAPGHAGDAPALADWLADTVFAAQDAVVVDPDPADLAGFATYLDRYRAGLALQAVAAAATPVAVPDTPRPGGPDHVPDRTPAPAMGSAR